MDYSSANTALWSPIIQIGIIAVFVLGANVLRRKLRFIRSTMIPTAVLAGFILLALRQLGIVSLSSAFLETVTYHALALGFIAMALRIPSDEGGVGAREGSVSGALIVSTYLVQGLAGLFISITLAHTVLPSFFDAGGILLALAYGQGPGQANNVGATYEALGFAGGKTFGLSLAAAGYLCACIVGVIFINVLKRRGALDGKIRDEVSGSVSIDTFQSKDEIPIASSVDKLSVQVALVFGVYLLTYLVTLGITTLLQAISPGLAATVSTLLWGFNFIIGSMVAAAVGVVIKKLRRAKIMNRQYQNNYLLSRISGLAFDLMIVSAIASIEINDLEGLWLPFVIMAVTGGIVTFIYLYAMSKKLYKNYFYEGFLSMYGMLTGTISSGVLLLREIDPEMETPASSNLVTGSSFGIIFGAPMLLVISYAGTGDAQALISCGILAVYLAALLGYIALVGKNKKK